MYKKVIIIYLLITISLYAGVRNFGVNSLAMGNTNLTFGNDETAMFYNPASLDILPSNFYLSLTQTTFNINNSFLPFTGFLLANILNFAKFANDIERINTNFANEVSRFDMKWMQLGFKEDFNIIYKNIGFSFYSNFNTAFMYDDGIYLPIFSFKAQHEAEAALTFSKRMFKVISVGIKPKVWSEVHDVAKVRVSKVVSENVQFIAENDSSNNAILDTNSVIYQLSEDFSKYFDYLHYGLDIGFIYHIKNKRIGLVLRDLVDVTEQEKSRINVDIGFGYRWIFLEDLLDIPGITFNFEVHDVTGKYSVFKKVYSGAEINWKPFYFRVGIAQGYPTWGVSLDFLGVRADFAMFTKELGDYVGTFPSTSYLFSVKLGI